jgi:hypothetical protein
MKTISLPLPGAYPKRIYFANECYKIRFNKRLKCYGITDAETKTITIKAGLSPRAFLETLIHELLHVIEFEMPLKMRHKKVYKLERAITNLVLDNFL